MLHRSETWPVRKENEVALQQADRFPSRELRERLGIDDITLVLQQNRLRWYGHVLRKDDDAWVKKLRTQFNTHSMHANATLQNKYSKISVTTTLA